jgi:hypothetical protein
MARRAVSTQSRGRSREVRRTKTTAPPPIAGRRLVVAIAVLAAVAAWLERWFFIRAWGEWQVPWSAFYVGDSARFVNFAVAILRGQPFDNGIPFHPPGWPLALAAFMRIAGAVRDGQIVVPVAAVKLFVAALSGLTVGVATLLAYEMAGFGAMLAVALLGPFDFGHMVEGTVANSEALYGLCTMLALWAVWRWLEPSSGNRRTWAALAGVIAGFATIVRPEFLACLAALAALAVWTRRGQSPREYALCAAAFAVVLAPTTVWHWRDLSSFNEAHVGRVAGPLPRFAPVTSYGPFNFAMANHEDADGGPNRDHPLLDRCGADTDARLTGGELDLACPAVYDLYVHGYTIGAGWLFQNPGAALRLLVQKMAYSFGFLAHGYLVDDVGAGVDGTRRRVDLVDPETRTMLPIHLLLMAAGIGVLRRQRLAIGILAAPAVAFVASTLMFYGYVRLGVAYVPAAWIIEASALSWLADRMLGRQSLKIAAAAVAAVVVLLLVVDGIRSTSPRSVVLDGSRAPDGTLMQDETLFVHQSPRR